MKTTSLIFPMVSLLAFSGCQERMVELHTDLPLASADWDSDNLHESRKGFLVPEGARLLSRGVEVTTSCDVGPIIGELKMITDGNRKKDPANYDVEIFAGEWVQLDLGKSYSLYGILVWHNYSAFTEKFSGARDIEWCQRVYQDVIVQVSNDPTFKKDVETVFNNDQDNSLGLGKGENDVYIESSKGCWINPEGSKGRYVRLYSNGYTQEYMGDLKHSEKYKGLNRYVEVNNYIEIEVYGY